MADRKPNDVHLQWFAEDDNKKALEEAQASIEKLEAKNRELIGELRKAKGTTNEEAAKLAAELDQVKADNVKLSADLKKALDAKTTVENTLKEQLSAEQSAVARLVLDNGLTDALTKAGVKSELMSAARALLREKGVLSIESEGDARRAIAKLKKDGKDVSMTLDEYITKEFATTDEGKAFIAAQAAGGAGAQGGKGGQGQGATMKRAEFIKLSPTEQYTKTVKEGIKLVD